MKPPFFFKHPPKWLPNMFFYKPRSDIGIGIVDPKSWFKKKCGGFEIYHLDSTWVFPKIVVSPNSPFVHRVWNPYFHHPFWGVFPLFLETPTWVISPTYKWGIPRGYFTHLFLGHSWAYLPLKGGFGRCFLHQAKWNPDCLLGKGEKHPT